MAAPAIREPDGGLQHAGGLATPSSIIFSASGLTKIKEGYRTIEPGGEPFCTDWLCGGILLIRREAFLQLNGFDPRYFLYFDETDLCRRAGDAGMELWAVGTAVGYHDVGASAKQVTEHLISGCIPEHYYRSRFYYLRKFFGTPAAVATELLEIALLALRALVRIFRLRGYDHRLQERLAGPIARVPKKVDGTRLVPHPVSPTSKFLD